MANYPFRVCTNPQYAERGWETSIFQAPREIDVVFVVRGGGNSQVAGNMHVICYVVPVRVGIGCSSAATRSHVSLGESG